MITTRGVVTSAAEIELVSVSGRGVAIAAVAAVSTRSRVIRGPTVVAAVPDAALKGRAP